jgi:hypothetical protein
MAVIQSGIYRPIELKRADFPQGFLGDREYFQYFISVMFEGPAGNSITQTAGLVTGFPGAGKTTFMTFMGWWIKECFNIPTTADFPLIKENYGDWEYLPTKEIIEEMVRVSDMVESGNAKDVTSKDSKLFRHCVLSDEIYKKSSNRRPMENTNQLISDMLREQRHWQSVFLFAAPAINELDTKTFNQYLTVDIAGVPSKMRKDVTLYFITNRKNMTSATLELYLPNYTGKDVKDGVDRKPMFDSFSAPQFRHKITKDDMLKGKAYQKVYCMDCYVEYDGSFKYCVKCGQKLMKAPRCTNSNCNSILMAKFQYCPKCGAENINFKGKKDKDDGNA